MQNNIKVDIPPEKREKLLLELLWILKRLRDTTIFWELHYGVSARDQKKNWEKRADKILKELGLKPDEN